MNHMEKNYIEKLEEIAMRSHDFTKAMDRAVTNYYKFSEKYEEAISLIFNPKNEKHNRKIIPIEYQPHMIAERLRKTSFANHENILQNALLEYKTLVDKLELGEGAREKLFLD